MDTLGGLVARDRTAAASVLETGGTPPRRYDRRRFRTTAWRTGNFLRHLGVREGTTVAVAGGPAPEPVFAFLGATLLGARVRFDPPTDPDCRAVVAPTADIGRFDLPPGGQRVGYGSEPADPTVSHFETEMWSENPAFPETDVVDGEDPALVAAGEEFSHRDLLDAAARVAEEHDFAAGMRVAVRAPLGRPGTVVAGLLAPLLADATILLPGEGTTGDVGVSSGDAPESVVVDPASVAFESS